jgi:hypothetical protein
VLRRMFGPKRDEIIGGWRKLYNDELHNLYSSPNITIMVKSRKMRGTGNIACMGDRRNAYWVSVEKTERQKPLGIPRCRREDNIEN